MKKTRALLRLARPAMRADAFRAYNRELRDQGRALSGARDADVMVETIDALDERNPRRVKRAHFMAVRRALPRGRGRQAAGASRARAGRRRRTAGRSAASPPRRSRRRLRRRTSVAARRPASRRPPRTCMNGASA